MISCSIIKKFQLEGASRLDAEYYQPKFLKLIKKIETLETVCVRDVASISKIKFKPKNDDYFEYIDIASIDLATGEYRKTKFLGKNAPDRAQWTLQKGDVIISTVRPSRNAVSLIVEDSKDIICSSGFAVLKVKNIEPEYLFVYLKTVPMINLLDRATISTMYPAVTVGDILNLRICLGEDNFRKNIKNQVWDVFKNLENSKLFYSQAEELLLSELGLKDFRAEEKLSCVVNLSDVKDAKRIDADYFQSEVNQILSVVLKHNLASLGDLLVDMKKGIEVGAEAYQDEGKLFIRVSSVSKEGVIDKDQKYLNDELYKNLKEDYEPQVGEILLTKDATPGIACVVREPINGIVSGGVMRLMVKKDIEPEYLALCINSIIGSSQVKRGAGGSIIAHWKPEQIRNLQIPILSKSIQQKISDLVKKSRESRKKAKELLEEAKNKVEELIEKGK